MTQGTGIAGAADHGAKPKADACYVCGGSTENAVAARAIAGIGVVQVCSDQCRRDLKFSLPVGAIGFSAGPPPPKPIDMVLHCPSCGWQHVDAPEPDTGWSNPPHKSHLCRCCLTVWRPADVTTNGVAAILTRGKADTFPQIDTEPVNAE